MWFDALRSRGMGEMQFEAYPRISRHSTYKSAITVLLRAMPFSTGLSLIVTATDGSIGSLLPYITALVVAYVEITI